MGGGGGSDGAAPAAADSAADAAVAPPPPPCGLHAADGVALPGDGAIGVARIDSELKAVTSPLKSSEW